MRKKFLILLFISFFLCGCKADYNLVINKNNINEEIKLYSDDKDEYKNTIYRGYNLEDNFKAFSKFKQSAYINTSGNVEGSPSDKDSNDMGQPIYKTKYLSGSNLSGVRFKYLFGINEYKYSYVVNTNVRDFDVNVSNEGVSLYFKDTYVFTSYKLLDVLNVNVTVSNDYDVVSHNADEISGNKYIWTLTRDNFVGKKLTLDLKYKVTDTDIDTDLDVVIPDSETIDTDDHSSSVVLIVFGAVVCLLFVFGLIYLFIKKGKVDKL